MQAEPLDETRQLINNKVFAVTVVSFAEKGGACNGKTDL